MSHSLVWFRTLKFKVVAVLAAVMAMVFGLTMLIIQWEGRTVLLQQSNLHIRQIGEQIVSELTARTSAIASLTHAIALAGGELTRDDEAVASVVSAMVDFDGDPHIAGGGLWPEPYAFEPEQRLHSFFWARDLDDKLNRLEGYNQEATGYHQETWYQVGRQLPPGQVAWSQSYMDTVSGLPMVTSTSASYRDQTLFGVATIDLSLEGLQAAADQWCA